LSTPAVPLVLWLDDGDAQDAAVTGGKAATLARLRAARLPVPDGFVLRARSGPLDAEAVAAVRAAYARLGEQTAVAVRSSAPHEDGAAASFAGQYVTVLDVTGPDALLSAVEACLRSRHGGEDYARALERGGGADMAVLVQRFVEPRAAGVAFTRDPRDASLVLVESHAGRGEELVSGRVTPERHRLPRAALALADTPAGPLTAVELVAVARLALEAEERLGAPQDVEWAWGDAGLVLLQSRPITVEEEDAPDPRARRLTRANVGEVLPDAVTPLTWTTVGALLEHGFQTVARDAGLLPPEGGPFLVRYRQRLYLNLTLTVQVVTRLPGISVADAERLVLGGGAGGNDVRLSLAALPRLLGVGLRLLGLARRLPRDVASSAGAVAALPGAAVVAAADAPALLRLLDGLAATGERLATTHIASSGASAVRQAVLGRLLDTKRGAPAGERVNRLLAGLDAVESASPTVALESLGLRLAADPDGDAWLRRSSDERAAAWHAGAVPPVVARELGAFLARFGHRGVSEGELRALSWGDDARPVLDAVATLARAERPPAFARAARAEARRADTEAILGRLGGLRRILFPRLLRGAQEGVRTREHTKSLTIALVQHARSLARAAGRLLAQQGALADEDDVFFLTATELRAALAGTAPSRAGLRRRRRAFTREGAIAAPREVDLDGTPALEPAGSGLRGIGVSGGVAVGRARLLRAGETPRLDAGEVLVAPVLDAAFGPLLASAAAAVAEMGGVLSHGSVVARELGVPCVVDVRGVMSAVQDGDRLMVDGTSGRVSVLRDEDASTATAVADVTAIAGPERFHALLPHAQARESVYFNLQDPTSGLVLVGSAGVRPGGRGEALVAIGDRAGRVLFGLDRGPAEAGEQALAVGGTTVSVDPVTLRLRGRFSAHAAGFPRAPLALLATRRTTQVEADLRFVPTTPAVDFSEQLRDEQRRWLEPLGAHHVEQSGAWSGTIAIDGNAQNFEGTGSRDHSWGRRDWDAADHWRLFTVRFGADLAVHALAVCVEGHVVEGGFVWRHGRAERITRVQSAGVWAGGVLQTIEVEIGLAGGPPLRLQGTVQRRITVPVQLDRRPLRHLRGRPWRLLLHEHFTRYTWGDRTGFGMAEITERPV
jgi:phosphohistidine swiveling domain-containing protein